MTQRAQIPIGGITTTSSYKDGDTYSLVNLRHKNGALRPVPPRKIVQKLSQKYNIIFVHKNNEYNNWIGVISENGFSRVYLDVRDEKPKTIASLIRGTINSVQQIGNTLSLITEDNIYYLFYQNEDYTFLGELPQVPVISMSTSTNMSQAELYFINEYGKEGVNKDNFIDATKGLVNKAIDLLVNGGKSSTGEQIEGFGLQLFDACYVRYAFRLYDGSLTKHSPPILVMPTKNILDIKTIDYEFINNRLAKKSKVEVFGYVIHIDYDLKSDFDNWKDIIESVDIFMSSPLGISNIENIRKDMPTKGYDINNGQEDVLDNIVTLNHYPLVKEITQDMLKNVVDTSTFYFMRSLKLGTESSFGTDTIPSKNKSDEIGRLENLISQEVMSDDNFSNHTYGAALSYVYNNRLHISNIKTTFFNGFNMGYFNWGNNYNGVESVSGSVVALCSEVEIQAGTNIEKVYSFYSLSGVDAPKLFSSALLSYPDARARRITIYEMNEGNTWYKIFTAKLEPHNFLNIAYYLNRGLLPIVSGELEQVQPPDTSKVITLSEPNKIKVSELNNPLVFKNINTYQIGNGTIQAMATNAMLVSDRNKGQFPLYIFTTQGIWSLNVGNGEVVYSTLSDPTSQKTPVSKHVCETPRGVIFITKYGLNILNNNEDTFITPHIEEQPMDLNIEMNNHCDGVVFNPEKRGFDQLVEDIRMLIYDPHNDEVIINCNSELNYVFNFKSGSFYQSTEKIDLVVGNMYPELFVVSDDTLKDYSSSQTPLTHVSFILRPLRYGTPDMKRIERMILRALLYGVTKPADDKFSLFMIHHSMDGVNFKALTGFPIKEGNVTNLDSNLMARSKSVYNLYTLAGIISEESKIYNLDAEYEKEYNNTKMR